MRVTYTRDHRRVIVIGPGEETGVAIRTQRLELRLRDALRDATYPAMVAADGNEVLGRLWLAVADDDLVRLDRFEGAEYRRATVLAEPLDGSPAVSAQAYLWVDPTRLLPQDWDMAAFERDHLRDFARVHGALGERD